MIFGYLLNEGLTVAIVQAPDGSVIQLQVPNFLCELYIHRVTIKGNASGCGGDLICSKKLGLGVS